MFPMKKEISKPQQLRHESTAEAKKETVACNDNNSDWRTTRRGLALGIPRRHSSAEATLSASTTVAPLKLTLNAQPHSMSIAPRVTLLELLRENSGLTVRKRLLSRT